MTDDTKAKWVEALRSSKYQQGRGRLHNLDYRGPSLHTYCCMGVLMEVAVKFQTNPFYPAVGEDFLPSKSEHLLEELNDQYKLTFNQIATLIELGEVDCGS